MTVDVVVPPQEAGSDTPKSWSRRLKTLAGNDKVALIALLFLIAVTLTAIFAPVVAPHDPTEQNVSERLTPPVWNEEGSSRFILGSDQLGRDNLSRIIYASRVTLTVAASVVVITMIIGTLLGLVAGFFGGKVDELIMGATDTLMAFPGLLMVLTIAVVMGPGLATIIAAMSARYWTTYTRVVRGQVVSLRTRDHVTAARALGVSEPQIVAVHIVPYVLPLLTALVPLEMGRVMLAEAAVSFLGLGVQPPQTSWGILVADGRDYLSRAWWLTGFAGLALFLTILASNLVGSWLRLSTDPMQRQR